MSNHKRLEKLESRIAPKDTRPLRTLVLKYPDGKPCSEYYAEIEREAIAQGMGDKLHIIIVPDEATKEVTERIIAGEGTD